MQRLLGRKTAVQNSIQTQNGIHWHLLHVEATALTHLSVHFQQLQYSSQRNNCQGKDFHRTGHFFDILVTLYILKCIMLQPFLNIYHNCLSLNPFTYAQVFPSAYKFILNCTLKETEEKEARSKHLFCLIMMTMFLFPSLLEMQLSVEQGIQSRRIHPEKQSQ